MNITRKATLRRLRPPSLVPVRIIFPYQRETPLNYGYTLAVPTTEPVVAPGDGTIEFIKPGAAGWRFRNAGSIRTMAIRIDHGQGIKTYLHGLGTVATVSPNITRGQVLGYSQDGEIFFAVEIDRSMVNPAAVNDFFIPRDGQIFYRQPNYIGQAPTIVRQVGAAITHMLNSGLSYFTPLPQPEVLFNIDFNGDGSKTGLAAVGVGDDDYWNVYDPVDFFISGYACTYYYASFGLLGKYFNLPTMVPLLDYRYRRTKVFLERIVPLSAVSGSGSSWDAMLAHWLGGYSGPTPYVNTFALRGLPRGDYKLYLYSEQGSLPNVSYFQVSVDGSTFTGNTNPSGATSFLQDDNYVEFDLSLAARSVVTFTTSGYLSGLQIRRTIL